MREGGEGAGRGRTHERGVTPLPLAAALSAPYLPHAPSESRYAPKAACVRVVCGVVCACVGSLGFTCTGP